MDILTGFVMFCVPPLFALMIHNYLRHGEMTGRRKVIFYMVYFCVINAVSRSEEHTSDWSSDVCSSDLVWWVLSA